MLWIKGGLYLKKKIEEAQEEGKSYADKWRKRELYRNYKYLLNTNLKRCLVKAFSKVGMILDVLIKKKKEKKREG